jgi:hypothetical protein
MDAAYKCVSECHKWDDQDRQHALPYRTLIIIRVFILWNMFWWHAGLFAWTNIPYVTVSLFEWPLDSIRDIAQHPFLIVDLISYPFLFVGYNANQDNLSEWRRQKALIPVAIQQQWSPHDTLEAFARLKESKQENYMGVTPNVLFIYNYCSKKKSQRFTKSHVAS